MCPPASRSPRAVQRAVGPGSRLHRRQSSARRMDVPGRFPRRSRTQAAGGPCRRRPPSRRGRRGVRAVPRGAASRRPARSRGRSRPRLRSQASSQIGKAAPARSGLCVASSAASATVGAPGPPLNTTAATTAAATAAPASANLGTGRAHSRRLRRGRRFSTATCSDCGTSSAAMVWAARTALRWRSSSSCSPGKRRYAPRPRRDGRQRGSRPQGRTGPPSPLCSIARPDHSRRTTDDTTPCG